MTIHKWKRLSYHINSINCTQFQRLVLSIQHHIYHSTDLGGEDVCCRIYQDTFLQLSFERCVRSKNVKIRAVLFFIKNLPLNARFYHITGHQFESLVKMVAKFWIWPMKVADERLEGIQLPEQILRGCTAIARKSIHYRQIWIKFNLILNSLSQWWNY